MDTNFISLCPSSIELSKTYLPYKYIRGSLTACAAASPIVYQITIGSNYEQQILQYNSHTSCMQHPLTPLHIASASLDIFFVINSKNQFPFPFPFVERRSQGMDHNLCCSTIWPTALEKTGKDWKRLENNPSNIPFQFI